MTIRMSSRFWIAATIFLSVLFAVLFFPEVHGRYSLGLSLLFTGVGIVVIWVVYIVRAYVFSRMFNTKK
jgi:hypothetical protein